MLMMSSEISPEVTCKRSLTSWAWRWMTARCKTLEWSSVENSGRCSQPKKTFSRSDQTRLSLALGSLVSLGQSWSEPVKAPWRRAAPGTGWRWPTPGSWRCKGQGPTLESQRHLCTGLTGASPLPPGPSVFLTPGWCTRVRKPAWARSGRCGSLALPPVRAVLRACSCPPSPSPNPHPGELPQLETGMPS